jgi:hypothetical protein
MPMADELEARTLPCGPLKCLSSRTLPIPRPTACICLCTSSACVTTTHVHGPMIYYPFMQRGQGSQPKRLPELRRSPWCSTSTKLLTMKFRIIPMARRRRNSGKCRVGRDRHVVVLRHEGVRLLNGGNGVGYSIQYRCQLLGASYQKEWKRAYLGTLVLYERRVLLLLRSLHRWHQTRTRGRAPTPCPTLSHRSRRTVIVSQLVRGNGDNDAVTIEGLRPV